MMGRYCQAAGIGEAARYRRHQSLLYRGLPNPQFILRTWQSTKQIRNFMDAKISLFKAQLIAAREYAAMKQEAKSIADEHDAIIEAAAKNLGIPVRWGSQPSNKQP